MPLVRENKRAQVGGAAEGEGEAGFPLSREPEERRCPLLEDIINSKPGHLLMRKWVPRLVQILPEVGG